MRAPVLGGGPVKQIKPQVKRERKVWTEEEKQAARAASQKTA
jgi:ATP-dependent RNA helicase RhlE